MAAYASYKTCLRRGSGTSVPLPAVSTVTRVISSNGLPVRFFSMAPEIFMICSSLKKLGILTTLSLTTPAESTITTRALPGSIIKILSCFKKLFLSLGLIARDTNPVVSESVCVAFFMRSVTSSTLESILFSISSCSLGDSSSIVMSELTYSR